MHHHTVAYLRQKRKALIKQLQKIEPLMLRGSLIERYKQCGKSNCHCVDGIGHGPAYYFSASMPRQKTVMVYIATSHKTVVEKALLNYRQAQQIMEKISDINRELLMRKATL